jgi:hypothetical protein
MMVGILLTAGCGWTEPPGYHQAHTLILTKIGENGSQDWSKKYDALGDVSGYHVVQIPQGDFIIFASVPTPDHFVNYQNQVIRISCDGDVVWSHSLIEWGCIYPPFVNPDGEIISFGEKRICRVSTDGSVISNLSLPFSSDSGIVTHDGGYVLTDSNEVVKIDYAGHEVWRYLPDHAADIDHLGPVYETGENTGYLISENFHDANVTNKYSFIHLTTGGTLIKNIKLDDLPEISIQSSPGVGEKQKTFIVQKNPPTIVITDINGTPTEKLTVYLNEKVVTTTSDGNFIMFRGQNLIKKNFDGSTIWVSEISNSTSLGEITRISQTNDGGCVILGDIQKRSTTWP